MSTDNIPSKDPADEGTLGGAFRAVFRKMMMSADGMLPATVVAYDRASNTATVRPIVALLTTSGAKVPRAQIARIPVLALGGGGLSLIHISEPTRPRFGSRMPSSA